jgi:hypothetical protein
MVREDTEVIDFFDDFLVGNQACGVGMPAFGCCVPFDPSHRLVQGAGLCADAATWLLGFLR